MSERDSIGKRILDLAKANLNALLDKAGEGGPLDQLSDEELEAELARRKERRLREDEEAKAREAAERAARERAEQRARERAAADAAKRDRMASVDEELARMKARAGRPGASPPPPNRERERKREAPRMPPPSIGEKRLRDLYAQLETPYGATFDEVKKSFRRLMRKYHPDLHVGDPVKHKTATQLTMSLTQAYNELEEHLARRAK
jgi:DnaJ-domain-containing protein 1